MSGTPSPYFDVEKLATLIPGGDHTVVVAALQGIRLRVAEADFRNQELTDGRAARREVAALRKALDSLGPFVDSRLRVALQQTFMESFDPRNDFEADRVRVQHDLVPDGIPMSAPVGSTIVDALKRALDTVEAELGSQRGTKGYGPGVRQAVPALVDLYCAQTGSPRPYLDARAGEARHGDALDFAHACLVEWYGQRNAPASAALVWLLS